jgi:Zn-dependent protease with chaperone function
MAESAATPKSGRTIFTNIDPVSFQHPLDRQATENLKKLVGFDLLVTKFIELRWERLLYIRNIASSVRVGPRQFPKLYEMLRESCAVLDVTEPEFYVSQHPLVNAFTYGHTNPFVVVYTGLLDLLNEEETMTVIAHEIGHIKCGHVLYYTMADSMRDVAAILGEMTLGVGRMLWVGIEVALMNWRRHAELSSDRAGLLVMQDVKPCISLLSKLAGGSSKLADQLSPEEFLEQAKTYDSELDKGLLERIYRLWADADFQGNHPFTVERAKELNLWVNSPEYLDILSGNYTQGVRKVQIKVNS